MRILFWTERFWPHIGGVEVLVSMLIDALKDRGHDSIVVTSKSQADLPEKGFYNKIPVHRFSFQPVLLRRNIRDLRETAKKICALKEDFAPDLIHINSCQPGVFFHLHSKTKKPAAVLTTIHEPCSHAGSPNSLLGRLLHASDWVAAVSHAALEEARLVSPDITRRSSVIHNGLPMPVLKPTPLPFDPPLLLCLGRVISDKGFDLAIKAFASLENRFPGMRLIVAGDGDARPELEKLAENLGIKGKVKFCGWIAPEDVPALINKVALVIVPSRWREPFGLVALQAAQMERPVVAAEVGGLPEIVVHRETGLLFERENPGALAEQIALLLEQQDLCTGMGKAARKRVREMFSVDRFLNSYQELYRNLVKEKHHEAAILDASFSS
jgi:glycogen(starch) synthase